METKMQNKDAKIIIKSAQNPCLETIIGCKVGEDLKYVIYEDSLLTTTVKSIRLGVVKRVVKSLNTAFVEIGSDKHGFLPLKEVDSSYLTRGTNADNPCDRLEIGQKILVQIEKEERGSKGAALTTFISIAGSYIVLLPNNSSSKSGISRQINDRQRQNIKQRISSLSIPANMKIILRTAGVDCEIEELQWDLNMLINLWRLIVEAADSHKAPCLIYQENELIPLIMRDFLRPHTKEIVVDDPKLYESIKKYLEIARPLYQDILTLYDGNVPIFCHYEIENKIEEIYNDEVKLPSGGELVFGATEALTSIDVNSAKENRGNDLEETALLTNLEAAKKIPDLLIQKSIGGLIVIDFIDMKQSSNKNSVEETLRKGCKSDRARIQIGSISQFGLLEMSRQRLSPSFTEMHSNKCNSCGGHGRIKKIKFAASLIIAKISHNAINKNAKRLIVTLNKDVALFINNEMRQAIFQIETASNKEIVIIPSENPDRNHVTIKTVIHTRESHEITDSAQTSTTNRYTKSNSIKEKPIVSFSTATTENPRLQFKMKVLFGIRSLFRKMFSSKPPVKNNRPHRNRRNHQQWRNDKKDNNR